MSEPSIVELFAADGALLVGTDAAVMRALAMVSLAVVLFVVIAGAVASNWTLLVANFTQLALITVLFCLISLTIKNIGDEAQAFAAQLTHAYIAPYARSLAQPWHPNADWIQDDVVDAEAAWRLAAGSFLVAALLVLAGP